MKVTRSYWLGLGSGLILSAMLTMVISPQQGQAVIPQEPSDTPVTQQPIAQPLAEGTKQTDPTTSTPTTVEPSVSTTPPSDTQLEKDFVIPKGASTERIAELLVEQGFLKDKESFLVSAKKMGVERQFIAGTFTLSPGLTPEEVIGRLVK